MWEREEKMRKEKKNNNNEVGVGVGLCLEIVLNEFSRWAMLKKRKVETIKTEYYFYRFSLVFVFILDL